MAVYSIRRLFLYFLSSLLAVSGQSDTAASFTDVRMFNKPLSELTKDLVGTSLNSQLQFPDVTTALSACQHEQLPKDEIKACDNIRYLFDVKQLVESSQSVGAEASLQKSDESSFSQLFVDFIEPRKPVLLKASEDSWSEENLLQLKQCSDVETDGTLAGTSLSTCPDVLASLKVPAIATNDYMVRLTPCALTGEPNKEACLPSPFIQTPSFLQIRQGVTTDLNSACPLGMTAVLEILYGAIDIVIYDPVAPSSPSSHSLVPVLGNTAEMLHHLSYSSSPFTDLKHVQSLDEGLLVLPNEMLVALRGRGEESGLLKHCFTDAASMHTVRQRASLEAHVDSSTTSLVAALSSLHLDTTMARQPTSMSWAQHMSWPRKEEGEGKTRKRRSQSDWQAETKWKWRIVALTLPKIKPPTVKALGRKNATLNWLSGFQVVEGDTTEFGYNITWHLGHDSQVAGNLSVPHSVIASNGHAKFAFDDYNAFDLTHTIPDGSLLPSTEYSFRVSIFYGQARSPTSSSSSTITTPPVSPPGRMNSPPVVAGSLNEVSVAVAVDLDTQVSLLAYPPLDDGGSPVLGYLIEARHDEPFMHGQWEVLGSYGPQLHDGMLRFLIDHLIPNTAYQFRISSYNSVGVSAVGSASAPISTGFEGKQHDNHVHGHGKRDVIVHHVPDSDVGESSAKLRDHLKSLLDPHLFQVHGPVITLSDHTETLTYNTLDTLGNGHSEQVSLAVWSGHWSPRRFQVTAELIMTDPPLAETRPLLNARAVRGRIALVERGLVPLVEKVLHVQSAGGIGVIIDAGECVAFNQMCSAGAEKRNGDGFGKLDMPRLWERVRIPVVMLLRNDVDTLLALFE